MPIPKVAGARAKFNAKQAAAVTNNRRQRLTPEARGTEVERAMRKEAKYLVDPLKLAHGVLDKLRENKLEEALELVRASDRANDGKGMDNIVSWNHILDWLMGQGAPGGAWIVYNEMKKRGHKPEAQTYTIMLRGYRQNVKKPNAVQQAISVYDSMSAANSAVTPNTIHTNALLNVCARAHDVDSLWKVAGKLPDRGPGAPDNVTFTTILQGLSAEIQKRAVDRGGRMGSDFDPQPLFNGVITDARKLWLDITARWRKGQLYVDESLVCAMGRLLMLSDDKQTLNDVLNLVHQTMNIPKMPEAAGGDLSMETLGLDGLNTDEQRPSTIDVPARSTGGLVSSSIQADAANTSVHAAPGTNTLSMLIETATSLREVKLGKYYWDLLTSQNGPYQVVPDHQNIMAYMRLLRVSRASRAVLDLLREERSEELQSSLMVRGTFVIAMSTCLRDKNNPNVFETASRIMDLMQESNDKDERDDSSSMGQKLRFSPKVLRMYLEIAIATTKGINGDPLEKTRAGDLDFERDRSKNRTLRALRRLGPDVFNVKQMIKSHLIQIEQQATMQERTITVKKLLEKRQITPYSTSENIADLVDLLRTMIGAFDKIILINEKLEDEGMGPLDADIVRECWLQKRKLSAYVTKYSNAMVEPRNPSEVRAPRRISERGLFLPIHWSSNTPDKTDPEGTTATEDVHEEDLAASSNSPRTTVMSEIKSAQDRQAKKFEERNLSRKQKIELQKKETIRAQFPASMLREIEPPKSLKSDRRERRAVTRDNELRRSVAAVGLSPSGPDENTEPVTANENLAVEPKLPVWKSKQLAVKLQRQRKREEKEAMKEARQSDAEVDESTPSAPLQTWRNVTPPDTEGRTWPSSYQIQRLKRRAERRERESNGREEERGGGRERVRVRVIQGGSQRQERGRKKVAYKGWGGGFAELADEEGRGRKAILEVGP